MVYLDLDFAEQIGLEDYLWLADAFGFVLGGERLFAKHFFGDDQLPADEQYYREILLRADPEFGLEQRTEYEEIERQIPAFLDHALASCDWRQYEIVGFTSSFQQTMPSLCLARRIKQLRPDVKIVLGGAACDSEMGTERSGSFRWWTTSSSVKPTSRFPRWCGKSSPAYRCSCRREWRRGRACADLPPRSLLRRRQSPRLDRGSFCNLDDLPYPDFDDYFDRLHRSPLSGQLDPIFFFETSRGCWWGQKHHCTFCGLNGRCLTYRQIPRTGRRGAARIWPPATKSGAPVRPTISSTIAITPRYCLS